MAKARAVVSAAIFAGAADAIVAPKAAMKAAVAKVVEVKAVVPRVAGQMAAVMPATLAAKGISSG